LFDELNASLNAALRLNAQRKREDLPVLPDGSLDRRIHSDAHATVTIPLWAFDVVYDLVMDKMLTASNWIGATARCWQKYRMDLIHGHRYALVKKAISEKRAYWPPKEPGVYAVVARELTGSAFAAKPSGIKSSVDVVTTALNNGERARFYRSSAAHYYDFLLNTPGPVTIVVSGAPRVKSSTSVG
jgi:hypothetical protein